MKLNTLSRNDRKIIDKVSRKSLRIIVEVLDIKLKQLYAEAILSAVKLVVQF